MYLKNKKINKYYKKTIKLIKKNNLNKKVINLWKKNKVKIIMIRNKKVKLI